MADNVGIVIGGKHVDPVSGSRYWWPDDRDEAPAVPKPLSDEWQDVGYVIEDCESTFFKSLNDALVRHVRVMHGYCWPVTHMAGMPEGDDKTAAVAAFIEHGGKPYEIFSIEKAYLGELVEYEECLEEFYTHDIEGEFE